VTAANPCRFCRLYAASVVGFAVPMGAAIAAQFFVGLNKFGGEEYVPRALILSAVRGTGPAVSGSALLLALVLWAHPLPMAQVLAELRRVLLRGLLASLPGYLVAVVLASAAGFAVASAAFGQSWGIFRLGFGSVGWRDFGAGLLSTALDAGLGVFLAWRYLARLQGGRMSLPAKLVVVVTVTVGLRATVGLILSSLLSG
jgi:ABC-type transporter Mla maintaining outer membrane lipid asymmetry permease subunit MlaE